jgi:hypothetical protein
MIPAKMRLGLVRLYAEEAVQFSRVEMPQQVPLSPSLPLCLVATSETSPRLEAHAASRRGPARACFGRGWRRQGLWLQASFAGTGWPRQVQDWEQGQ